METPDQQEIENHKALLQLKIEKYKILGQLQVEQYKSLRSEIYERLKVMQSIELYSIIGLSAYYAWIFNKCFLKLPATVPISSPVSARIVHSIPWLIPIFVPLFGWWRNRKYAENVRTVSRYLRKVESQFSENGNSIGPENGWETHMQNIRDTQNRNDYKIFGLRVFTAFWVTLIIAVIFMAMMNFFLDQSSCREF